MVMKAPPWIRAVQELAEESRSWRVLLTPRGGNLTESKVRQLADYPELILLCGRYAGVDERVRQTVVNEMIAQLDEKLSAQVNEILHHDQFQKMESAWRKQW